MRVTNTGRPAAASLVVYGAALGGARDLELWIGPTRVATATIDRPAWYRFGPIHLPPGETPIALRVPRGDVEGDAVLRNGDTRRLAIRVDDWRWDPLPQS